MEPGEAAAPTGVASQSLPPRFGFFSVSESVFINDYLKLAEGSLVCNLSF